MKKIYLLESTHANNSVFCFRTCVHRVRHFTAILNQRAYCLCTALCTVFLCLVVLWVFFQRVCCQINDVFSDSVGVLSICMCFPEPQRPELAHPPQLPVPFPEHVKLSSTFHLTSWWLKLVHFFWFSKQAALFRSYSLLFVVHSFHYYKQLQRGQQKSVKGKQKLPAQSERGWH